MQPATLKDSKTPLISTAIISQRLDNITDLPTIPHSMQQVLLNLDSVAASAASLEKIIREDPVLTAKLLKMANSAAYGTTTEISSVKRAIVTLGFEEVRSIVIGLSLTGAFNNDLGFPEFDANDLWLHAIAVGNGARLIAKHTSGLDPDELFTAGMLHDLGRLLFCLYFPDELRDIISTSASEDMPLPAAEEKHGLSHTEIGAYLAIKWKLSDFIISLIRYHHHPRSAGPHAKAAAALMLADALAIRLQIGWNGLGIVQPIMIPKILGINNDQAKEIVQQLKKEKENILSSWGSVISD